MWLKNISLLTVLTEGHIPASVQASLSASPNWGCPDCRLLSVVGNTLIQNTQTVPLTTGISLRLIEILFTPCYMCCAGTRIISSLNGIRQRLSITVVSFLYYDQNVVYKWNAYYSDGDACVLPKWDVSLCHICENKSTQNWQQSSQVLSKLHYCPKSQ